MGKCIKRSLMTIMLLFFLFGGLVQFREVKAVEDSKIEMKAYYGIEERYKIGKAVPVFVELTNNSGSEVTGTVEVRAQTDSQGGYDSFGVEVSIGNGETEKYTIPVSIPEGGNKLSVVLEKDGKIISEKTLLVESGRVIDFDILMGTLTDDFNGISYMGSLKVHAQPGTGNVASVPINEGYLDQNLKTIEALDVMVINNFATSNFTQLEKDNISAWVNNGGYLIIGTGANVQKTLPGIQKDVVEIQSNGTSTKKVNILGDSLNLTLANLSVKNGKSVLKSGEDTLIYSVEKGLGKVFVATYDLGTEPMATYSKNPDIWNSIISEKIDTTYVSFGKDMYGIHSMLDSIPVQKESSILTFVILYGLYTLVVGLGIYLVLKKLNKRDYLWGVIPATAIVFTVIIFILGSSTRVKDIILNQANIINVDENGNGIGHGYVGIGSKQKSDLKIEEPTNGVNINYLGNPFGNYIDQSVTKQSFTNLGVRTMYEGTNSYFEFEDSGALAIRPFEVNAYSESGIDIKSTMLFTDKGVKGTVTNNTENDFRRSILVIGKNIWDLGYIKKGETVTLTDKAADDTGGIMDFSNKLIMKYYEKTVDLSNKEIARNYRRDIDFLTTLANMPQGNKPYLLFISDKEVDYGIELETTSVSKYDTTALIKEIKVDYKDENGNANYPIGYFTPEVLSKDNGLSLEQGGDIIFGNGKIELEYQIKPELQVESIKLIIQGNDMYKGNGNLQGSIYAYNYTANQYDQIVLDSSSEMNFTVPKNYLKDNKLKIKIEGKEEQATPIPQISVKGRE